MQSVRQVEFAIVALDNVRHHQHPVLFVPGDEAAPDVLVVVVQKVDWLKVRLCFFFVRDLENRRLYFFFFLVSLLLFFNEIDYAITRLRDLVIVLVFWCIYRLRSGLKHYPRNLWSLRVMLELLLLRHMHRRLTRMLHGLMTAHVLLHLLHLKQLDVHLKGEIIVRTVKRRTNVLPVNKIINRSEKMKDDS